MKHKQKSLIETTKYVEKKLLYHFSMNICYTFCR